MPKFEDMTSNELQQYLLGKCQVKPGIPVEHNGPRLAIKSIDTRYLPLQTAMLVNSIDRSAVFPIDLRTTEERESKRLGISTCGAMRSWHNNDFKWLPHVKVDAVALSGKPLSYYRHVSKYCGTPNNQKLKVGEIGVAGYVEYTAGGWREGHSLGRVVYNYVNNLIFFTALHYQKEQVGEDNPFFLVVGPDHIGSATTF